MTLARKLLLKNLALLVGLLLLGCITTWGLLGLRAKVQTLLVAYRQLQRIETAETSMTAVKMAMIRGQTSGAALTEPLQSTADQFNTFFAVTGYDYATGGAAEAIGHLRNANGLLNHLLLLAKEPASGGATTARLQDMTAASDDVLTDLHEAATACDGFIQQQQQETEDQFRATIIWVSILAVSIFGVALVLGIADHRRIVLPLRRLGVAMRHVSAGHFQQGVEVEAAPEFRQLASEFNMMAARLDDLYRSLEEKVAEKSRELVRSERLASVGFLAAGVAHEINNPLNIISGYAELSLKDLKKTADVSTGATDAVKSLQIIRDEAFRCKEITGKLLSLARGSGEARVLVSLPKIASDVVGMVGGLSRYRNRRLSLEFDQTQSLTVLGNVTEMKQVLLNLTVNALEATRPSDGEVKIQGIRNNDSIELSVRDNGRGMTRETLERVFEPFYTERRGTGDPGTGLGLTITHAIIENHGGQIRAESDGPGRGSRFVIRLPAANRIRELESVT
jgi:two-component system, NtrC family, sensor kinase